jgi:hypothetical protein
MFLDGFMGGFCAGDNFAAGMVCQFLAMFDKRAEVIRVFCDMFIHIFCMVEMNYLPSIFAIIKIRTAPPNPPPNRR